MTVTTLHEIPRDRYGRPMVIPPNGDKPTAYTRCTTYVSCLEDTYNLGKWMQRMTAKGLSMRPDLLLAVSATDVEDKRALDAIVDDAREAAAANAAATIGTALHSLTEQLDRGLPIGVIPDAYQADLDAYAKATEPLTALMIEQFTVLDELKVGGTPDRVVEYQGRNYIADVKTGAVSYGAGKIAMQLAVYAHSKTYDHVTGHRADLPDVDQDKGIVIHLPAGTGTCELLWVDIKAGWEAVELCADVRKWRARKNLMFPMSSPLIDDEIRHAKSVDELNGIYFKHADIWTDVHTELAAARKVLLQGDVVT